MYYRCELLIGGIAYDATNELVNWADVEMSFKRSDYDGVVRSFSTKFEFANGAYSLLLKEYLSNYLNSSATLVFYTRNNSWLLNEKFRCALDYSTFAYNDTTCEINAVDNSLASLIKAKKGAQYEYPVSELKESQPLYYDRLEMTSEIQWTIPIEDNISKDIYVDKTGRAYVIPLYLVKSEIATKNIVEAKDQEERVSEKGYPGEDDYCLKYIGKSSLKIHVKARFTISMPIGTEGYLSLGTGDRYSFNSNTQTQLINIDREYTIGTAIEAISMYVYFEKIPLAFQMGIRDIVTPFTIDFMSRDTSVNIDVIKPITLLNRLLRSINNEKDGVTGEISIPNQDAFTGIKNAMIVPAESIRGLNKAKIYTSYTKFANWMSSEFGFVPVISDNKVTFVHRNTLFQDKEIKNLKDGTTDLEYNINAGLVYSRLKVGYDKQDYDSVNGRDEFHFTNEYTTGVTLTDNVLEMISPYRADAYGIEFLVAKRGEETTDSDSDNDVFFVGASLSGGKYQLIRWNIAGVISPSTMFNAMYSQRHMIEANAGYIAAFAKELIFASSDGNSDVKINGISETADIALGDNLFTVGELSVETGDLETPSDLSGYIRIEKNGHVYKGYVKSASYNFGRAESVKYSLIVKSID